MDEGFPIMERDGREFALRDLMPERACLFREPPRMAMVVGTFAAVPYVHLHLEARRRWYPGVPLLVHDDHSPVAARLAALCGDYGADFERNTVRLPPCKGDLSAFAGGFHWARERGAELLLKLSRRFVPISDWRPSLAALAMESQYATHCSWTTTFGFGFRSECVAMAVEEWQRLLLAAEIARRIAVPGQPFVEGFLHELARRAARFNCGAAREYDARVGERPPERNGYAPWEWMGTDRKARSENFLWHDCATARDYHALGQQWGLPYAFEDYADPNAGFGSRPRG